jgi:hypothetical protein
VKLTKPRRKRIKKKKKKRITNEINRERWWTIKQ